MKSAGFAQPDVTLHLDMEGVITDVSVSNGILGQGMDAWIGRPWAETVADVGDDKVRRMVEDARSHGVSAFRQVNQRFPSGLELPIEYTAVRLGRKGGVMAVGKSLKAVADLQSRLIAAQQAMERDYWKLRNVETRYRLVFDASSDPILVMRASNLHVLEANPAAIRALGFSPAGREFMAELAAQEREPFQAMLLRVREHGKAPAVLVHLGQDGQPWLVRASLMTSEPGQAYMLQLATVGASSPGPQPNDDTSLEMAFEHAPDGLVVTDEEGVIRRANRAFLDMVQVGAEGSILGQRLGRWLERPGADHTVLLTNVRAHGIVRLLSTTVQGDLGTRTEVEISAAGDFGTEPKRIVMVVRDAGQRLPVANGDDRLSSTLSSTLGSLTEQVGKTPLRSLVRDTVGEVERHYMAAALAMTQGNRTAAAELLGLSRQSLYAKMNRYGLQDGADDG